MQLTKQPFGQTAQELNPKPMNNLSNPIFKTDTTTWGKGAK
jgi:hypothetical protein